MVNVNVSLRNEAVRRFRAAFEGDDDAFRQTLDAEIEWCPIEESRVPLHGVEAAVRNRNAWLDTWDEHQFDVDEVVDEGDDVAALIHLAGRGKGSGRHSVLRPSQGARRQDRLHLRPRGQGGRARSRRDSRSLQLALVDAKRAVQAEDGLPDLAHDAYTPDTSASSWRHS
jgi:ketosteroid isomerase-like protein